MELKDISDLLDRKFDEKLKPIHEHLIKIDNRLDGMDKRFNRLEKNIDTLQTAVSGILVIVNKNSQDSIGAISA